jgi:F0F1-type ATP synthase assembly protein I
MEKNLNSPQKEQKKKSAQPNDFLKYTGMATKMAVVILGGVYFGRWLDKEKDFPLFTLIFSLLAVAVAIYIVIKDTSK